MTYIINGEVVEYLHIENTFDGDTIVTYSEKFDIITAHMGEIMKKLRDNGLHNTLVFKDLKHDIITITYGHRDEITSILHLFNIPYGSYEVLEEDKFIVLDIPLL